MEPKRILQSLATLDRGGAEAMIMNLYRHLDREQFQFDFIVNETDKTYDFAQEVRALGGHIHYVPKFNGKNLRAHRLRMKKLLQEHPEWRIMHIHNTSSAMFFLDLAKKYHVKTIAHAHFDADIPDVRSNIQRMMRLPLKYRADYLLACSKLAGAYVFTIDPEEVTVLNNAIETEKYIYNEKVRIETRAALGIAEKTVVLGHVGRIDAQKNHKYLVDIFKAYQTINPDSVLILIGKGELQAQIEQQVARYNLTDKVWFLGVRADVPDLLQAMDIFVFPSLFEGLPVTLVEAQAAGLPVIASAAITREVVLTELVEFLQRDINPQIWAEKINKSLMMFRQDMSQQIIQAGYDVQTSVHGLEEYYYQILEDVS